jgi:poly-gamma-glutamate synthesis protein (capsule biosynthesis protein)
MGRQSAISPLLPAVRLLFGGDAMLARYVAVVLMHAGNEYAPKPESRQRQFARAAIDAGAKLVVGHHPHAAQEAERYRGGAIFYSLGNFIFDQFQRSETQRGLVAEAVFRGRRLAQVRLRAIQIRASAPVFSS